MKKEMSTESASHDHERLIMYKLFAIAFSYPNHEFFEAFPKLRPSKEILVSEYDRLFRALEIWLYATEYLAENEFQKSNYLSAIMGFYRAFGLEPNKDRADALSNAFEFMHFLIFKLMHAEKDFPEEASKDKSFVCRDAQRKFFIKYIHPSAMKIAEAIVSNTNDGFYKEISEEMLDFLEKEKVFLKEKP